MNNALPDGTTEKEHPDTQYWEAWGEAGGYAKHRCEEEGGIER